MHGWECGEYTRIYKNRVEARFDHSKASDSREFTTLARGTASGLDMGRNLAELCAAWGRTAVHDQRAETGERYSYIDYYVLRVEIAGMTETELEAMLDEMERQPPQGTDALKQKYLRAEAHRRLADDDDNRKYINVAGGRRIDMEERKDWWRENVGGVVAVNPGPMLAATCNGGTHPTDMPLQPGSLSNTMKKTFSSVYEQLLESNSEELEGQSAGLAMNLHGPRWNSHSCRRGGTKKAREGPASRELIDAHFRWGAKEAKRQQQVAYASLEEAVRRIEVTAHF